MRDPRKRQEQLLVENLGNKGSGGARGLGLEKRNGDNRESWAGQHGLNRGAGRADELKPEAERLRFTVETQVGTEAGSEEAGGEVESGL